MAKWLLEVNSGIPERLLELIENLPEDKKCFNPFKDQKFRELFDLQVGKYKNKLSTFKQRYKTLKLKFRVNLNKENQFEWTAEATPNSITFFKKFFKKKKYMKLIYQSHELTHILQDLLLEKSILHKFALKSEDVNNTVAYYNNKFEIEPWTKDFYLEILHKRKYGRLRTETSVVKWLEGNKHFKFFTKINKKRIKQKILSSL